MILREFIYVDVEKVRGLLAQLDEGIVESHTELQRLQKRTGMGVKGFADHDSQWSNESSSMKSQADALFPTLESVLEAEGQLTDLSEPLQDAEFWDSGSVKTAAPAGTLVRITSDGSLFDARWAASTMAGYAATMQGLVNMGSIKPAPLRSAPLKKGQQGGQAKRPVVIESGTNLEDLIPDTGYMFGTEHDENAISREMLQGVIQVSRGMYAPGLYLNMQPTGQPQYIITARLQDGRQFLDAEASVLFSRYGGGAQEWTMVGYVGHHAEEITEDEPLSKHELVSGDNVSRGVFAEMVNRLIGRWGTLGFVDLPQSPGFSMVPLAVYRVINPAQVEQNLPALAQE